MCSPIVSNYLTQKDIILQQLRVRAKNTIAIDFLT